MYFLPQKIQNKTSATYMAENWPQRGVKLNPVEAIKLAAAEAMKGSGFVAPNPLVGCVILDKSNGFLGKGHHARVGGAHAEINALNSITEKMKLVGAKVFVTLEPCAHYGRTPPCTKALIEAKVAEVTYGLEDPNPHVVGNGAKHLRQARIIVKSAQDLDSIPQKLKENLRTLAEVFIFNKVNKKTFISGKVATSLDGKVALADGDSRWITNERSRRFAHFLRAYYQAVLIGGTTLDLDNPQLTVRHSGFTNFKNTVLVLDPTGKRLLAHQNKSRPRKIFAEHAPEQIYWIVKSGEFQFNQQTVLPAENILELEHMNLKILPDLLFARGIHSLMVEGGGQTLSRFLSEGLVQRLFTFVAPKILGRGRNWTETLHINSMNKALELACPHIKKFGSDTLISGTLFD